MRLAVTMMALVALATLATTASAAPVATTTSGASYAALDGSILVGDTLSGLLPSVEIGGWHPANLSPADQLPAFTDDIGALGGLTGLLNDFPGAGNPAKTVQYDLANPTNIDSVQILSGNMGNDGRVFSTTVVSFSTDGVNFPVLGYYQSDPSGTINSGQWGSKLVTIADDLGGLLGSGVTNILFEFYAVDNNGGQMRDPYDGVNPFTGIDDALTAAFTSPLIYEIDVDGTVIPEPTSCLLLGIALAGLLTARRRTR
jgi:hypothetical protein